MERAFQHIPSHQGIFFNEEVDSLANQEILKSPEIVQNSVSTILYDALRYRNHELIQNRLLKLIFKDHGDNFEFLWIKSQIMILRR